ncbi:MAG: HAD family hydrolase [Prolixibacteraceae bacterium]|jgi:Cof subfamily protein (haloacid dehalogenase superfamily)|nr:HAD family hydrolase [Prolixibacteraceae bacterium]
MNKQIKLVGVDLDGTLLNDQKMISATDTETLKILGKKGIVRVLATGRSLFKVKEVLRSDLPIDYVVFSSGGGVYDWKNGDLLQSEHFDQGIAKNVCKHLLASNYNFFVYKPIPDNNLFYYHKGAGECREFSNYLERHKGDFSQLNNCEQSFDTGQFMAIVPNDDVLFERLKSEIHADCKGVRVVRATSPVNSLFTWIEIFPEAVSKGHGLKWLCDKLYIDYKTTLGIGNDFNDLDMFEFVEYPYLLENGVDNLKQIYKSVALTNNESGFSKVIELFSLI